MIDKYGSYILREIKKYYKYVITAITIKQVSKDRTGGFNGKKI